MVREPRDITIIGAGPTGLFAQFYAGMRQVSSQIIDALPDVGGQLTALYPEKFIFDIAGFPQVLAKDLVKVLVEQNRRFDGPVHLGQQVTGLERDGDHFAIITKTDRFPTRAIIIAAGIGAFSPRRLPQAAAEPWYGRGVYDVVSDPEKFRGHRVIIIGGGDTAFDWGVQLLPRAKSVTIVHRTDRFRAHDATVNEFRAAAESGRASLLVFHELNDLVCKNGPDRFSHVVLRDVKAKTTHEVEADTVLPMLGFVSDMGVIADWGLTFVKDEIVVNSQMETGQPGIYAAGDVTTYPGKLKLIALGFSEAAIAVNQAVHRLHPDKKVAPGHSSNMAIFGQKDD